MGGASSGGVSQHALRWNPPVNRMTNRCKNITLPQTSFVGDKNGSMFYEKFGPEFMSECFFAKFILLDIVSFVGCISLAKLNKLTEQLSQKQCSWSLCTSKTDSSFVTVLGKRAKKAHTLLPIQQVLKK